MARITKKITSKIVSIKIEKEMSCETASHNISNIDTIIRFYLSEQDGDVSLLKKTLISMISSEDMPLIMFTNEHTRRLVFNLAYDDDFEVFSASVNLLLRCNDDAIWSHIQLLTESSSSVEVRLACQKYLSERCQL